MTKPAFTYVVKAKYWYFRRSGLMERLPGAPGDSDFAERYSRLLAKSERPSLLRTRRRVAARQRRLTKSGSTKPGIVYFIGGNVGPVKIGFTANLDERLSRLQMNSPQKLRVLAAFAGSAKDELDLHRLFDGDRLHGEWFKRSPEIVARIREIEDQI